MNCKRCKRCLLKRKVCLPLLRLFLFCQLFFTEPVEFELNEQRKKIYALENIEETEPSDAPNINKIVRNAGGKFVFNMV